MSAQLFNERIALKILILGEGLYGVAEMVRLGENGRERVNQLIAKYPSNPRLCQPSSTHEVRGLNQKKRNTSNIKTSSGWSIFSMILIYEVIYLYSNIVQTHTGPDRDPDVYN